MKFVTGVFQQFGTTWQVSKFIYKIHFALLYFKSLKLTIIMLGQSVYSKTTISKSCWLKLQCRMAHGLTNNQFLCCCQPDPAMVQWTVIILYRSTWGTRMTLTLLENLCSSPGIQPTACILSCHLPKPSKQPAVSPAATSLSPTYGPLYPQLPPP